MKQIKNVRMSALGRYGGKQTLKKYGRKQFQNMAKKRWKAWREAHNTPVDKVP